MREEDWRKETLEPILRIQRIDKLISYLIAGVATLAITFGWEFGMYSYSKQPIKEYEKRQRKIDNFESIKDKVMGKFDEDENGAISLEEGVKLARALGYTKTFPTNQIVFQIRPYDPNYAYLQVSSSGSSVNGLFTDGTPVWNEYFMFPISRLEELVNN